MLFAELSVACIFISLLSPAWTMSHVHDPVHCGTKHCNGNGICEKPKHMSSQMEVKCKCIEGFVGEHCQIETVISRRCYSRLDETDEKNQIPGIGECPDGQWCLPDNFYCHFYDCPNSIGWLGCVATALLVAIYDQSATRSLDAVGGCLDELNATFFPVPASVFGQAFNKSTMRLVLFFALFLTSVGASSMRKVSSNGTTNEFIDLNDKNLVRVSLNEDGSAPIPLSDDDFVELSNLHSHVNENSLAAGNNGQEELSHTAEPIKPNIRARNAASTNPGTLLRLTKKGLDYGTEIGSRLLEKFVRTVAIPDIEENKSGFKIRVRNLKLTQLTMPVLTNRLISPNSLEFHSNGGSGAIRADFQVKKKILFWISVSGWIEASISNLDLGIQTQLVNNALGKPQISKFDCRAAIGNFNFKIHGAGIAGWGVNLIRGIIAKKLKNIVLEQFNKQINRFGMARGNSFLSDMATDVRLFDGLRLDYGLTGAPNVHGVSFDLPLKGETTINGKSDTPFQPNALQLPPTDTKMAAVFLSD
uniref:EGF-like domain-containing protein n=1 Tax=Plectus sambesii TaxID=2011161 RepID=A0A914W7J0_9BILA